MACLTYQCSLELCCDLSTYENININFSCEIDPTNPPFNEIVILWTGNTNTPPLYRNILQCYNIVGVTQLNYYDPNAWEINNQYIFTGSVRCNICAQRFPCNEDRTCRPCNGITQDGFEITLYNRCITQNCLNWDNPIIFHHLNGVDIQRIKMYVGTNTGNIDFTFDAFYRPNRFQIWWDYNGAAGGLAGMTKVCDSLFVGNGLRYFRNDVRDYWRNKNKNVWVVCEETCTNNFNISSPIKPGGNPNYPNYCLTSGFTENEIDNGPFLALRTSIS